MPKEFQHIKFRIDERVARITFARPPLNVFDIAMMRDMIDATEALRLGLVNYVAPSAELEPKLQGVLGKVRDLSASALAMTRTALDLGGQNSFQSALTEIENLYLHELMKTEDAQEGVRSFMEKRKPEWHHK